MIGLAFDSPVNSISMDDVRALDIEQSVLAIRETKTGKRRTIALDRRALAVVERRLERHADGARLFQSTSARHSRRDPPKPITRKVDHTGAVDSRSQSTISQTEGQHDFSDYSDTGRVTRNDVVIFIDDPGRGYSRVSRVFPVTSRRLESIHRNGGGDRSRARSICRRRQTTAVAAACAIDLWAGVPPPVDPVAGQTPDPDGA